MQLREHQHRAVYMIAQALRQGWKRPMVAAPTAFGKTILAAYLMKRVQDKGNRGWFFCDRKQLVEQTIIKFREFGINFGVRQASHELHDPTAPIQIASIQTVAAMCGKHGKNLPIFDFAIIDEAHSQYEIIDKILEQYNNLPIVGLSATPYSKGLGAKYNSLIVPATPAELLEEGFLCPVKYYGGEHIDLSKVRSAGHNAFNPKDLRELSDDNADMLTGSITRNWLKYGENSQTIAFSPTQNLSKALVDRFNSEGISAQHIDCYVDQDDREALFEAHDRGEFKVLSCSRLLNTGYDAPSVRCIVDCFPTKSVTTYVQRIGRIMRTAENKDHAIYLDHAGNFERFGYAEDIVPTSLHDGSKQHNEKSLTNQKDKKDPKTRECPQCSQQMMGRACKACGWEIPVQEQLVDDNTMLKEMTEASAKKANKTDSIEVKEQFLSELKHHCAKKGYKPGWAANQYREKYGVWPNKIKSYPVSGISDMTKGWLKHQAIKRARAA
jgi:DNA repair protein RadD